MFRVFAEAFGSFKRVLVQALRFRGFLGLLARFTFMDWWRGGIWGFPWGSEDGVLLFMPMDSLWHSIFIELATFSLSVFSCCRLWL